MNYYKRQDGDAFIKRYCDGSLTDKAAFACGSIITIEFFIKQAYNPSSAFFYLGNDREVIISLTLSPPRSEGGYEVFSVTIDSKEITGGANRGLFFYHFEAETANGRLYTQTDGVNCTLAGSFRNEWQMSVYTEEYKTPEWLDGGVIYQIFIDRFAKGGVDYRRADAVYNYDWDSGIPEFPEKRGDDFPNNSFFGGTLYGAAEKIDYLYELGVTCVYLNPVFEAFSNHKYDVGDYMKVDDMFGGDKALEYFVKKASERGIAVVLDGVFNHVGADSVYFNRYGRYSSLGAFQSTESPYYDWFSFTDFPEKYDSWWGLKNLPKIKRNESYDSFICNTVIPKYMAMGIAGWRLDVVDELSSGFTERITEAIKEKKDNAVVIGEVWEDATNKIAYDERKEYFLGKQLDSVTNYPIRDAIIEYVLHGSSALLKFTMQILYEHYPAHKLSHIMNIVGTHDTERIFSVLGGEGINGRSNAELATDRLSEQNRRKAVKRLKNAYLLLAFMPGVPCIYYGDEAGVEGWHDPFNRRPFPWNSVDSELYEWFIRVNKLRAEEPLFKSKQLRIYDTDNNTFTAERFDNKDCIVICANMSENTVKFGKYEKTVDNCEENMYNHFNDMPAESVRVFKKAENQWKLLI
ncbi:MAG: alpha-glycosidase [Firmicutes bacterium HGW-Firmicutes-21]|nr:MAG: alpha-glycosidase [Firmicutes bacterium HGW-Firmicutes-21]